ncbi:MAG TPA: DUF3307 domain-containing protein [Candidatus Paceibacterota bacterium]|nr:DUF3307 domain-containing protein [Candidatus Paceibacterota bacterium]
MFLETIFLLWFAHCIGDMVLQSSFMSEYKGKFWYPMFSHVFIWTMCISLVLNYFEIFTYWKFGFLFIGHWLMDKWKSNTPRDDAHRWCMYVDQGWHFIQIIVVAVL